MRLTQTHFSDIKAVLFDFDGTLYDFRNLTRHIIANSIFDIMIVKAERETRKLFKGCDYETESQFYSAFFADFSKRTGKTEDFLKNWYMKIYMPRLAKILSKHYCAREGTEELFRALRASSIKSAIFSDYTNVEQRLEAIGLDPCDCDFLYSSEQLGALKPSVSVAVKICDDMQLHPSQILMVGDRIDTDIALAKAMGMKYVHIRTHKTEKEKSTSNNFLIDWDSFCPMLMQYAEENPQQIISA